MLFYDKSLSINNSVSCGSCHKQSIAFSDNKAFSRGFENFQTTRNTPPIQNLGLGVFVLTPGPFGNQGQALFWDGRERLLKNMVVQPVFNHVEMGMRDTKKIQAKVASRPYYEDLFLQAFGDKEITFERIAEALTGFVASIESSASAFDISKRGPGFNGAMGEAEQRGLELFFGKYNCGSCHNLFSPAGYSEPLESELLNIGLDMTYADKGKGALTGKESDNGKFKIPNLRNIALTAPYMHDGRFATLEEVLDHYNTGVKDHPNLDDRLKDASGHAQVLNITESERRDMLAFLNSLTDRQLISDPKYSNPFKSK